MQMIVRIVPDLIRVTGLRLVERLAMEMDCFARRSSMAALNVTQVGLVGPQVCISICVGTPSNPTNDSKLEVKVSPLFAMTGPGAVTDNMFNVVSDPTRTAAEVTAGTPAFGMGSRDPAQCGNTAADGTFDSNDRSRRAFWSKLWLSSKYPGYSRTDRSHQEITPFQQARRWQALQQ
ncbi:MAG: hypothetical protein MPW15_22565 [Candidatus Manganitrophus sp.]|nr:hypothetical protein [Candidatus Manganitrophus sp.]